MKVKFSDEEWFLLSSVPAAIGALMSAAAPSGFFGTIKELGATMKTSVQGLQTHPDSLLIAELLEKSENWSEAKEKASDYRERAKERFKASDVDSREKLNEFVLADCKAVAALVDERCSETDAAAYKDWCLSIAVKVAEAAKEGSILGFGGTQVSEAEKAQLAKIETALGASSGKLLTLSGIS